MGLDREAAKRVLGKYLDRTTLRANQIEFLNLIVDQLTRHGAMPVGLLYESPFTDIAPQGPEAVFPPEDVRGIVTLLDEVNERSAG